MEDLNKSKYNSHHNETEMSKIGIIALISAGLLIGLLFFSIQSVVSPFLIFFAIEFLLYPLRYIKFVRTFMWLAGIIFSVWFLFELRSILLPFIIAILLAYLFNPLVTKLETKGIKRWLSSLMLIIILLAVFASLIIFIMPLAIQQFNNIFMAITDITGELVNYIKHGKIFAWLTHYGIDTDYARERLSQELTPKLEDILKNLLTSVFGFISSISVLITQIINIFIIPFLAFYLLKDFVLLVDRMKSLIPVKKEGSVVNYLSKVDKLIGKYLRGALIVAFIHGILVGVLLAIFGIKYPVVLGMIAGVLSIIPYFGLFISLSLSLIVALFSGDPVWLKIVFVLSTFGFLQILEASVISPNILGKQVGLHPVLLILSLLLFGYFLGFLGLLIAVPVTAIIIMTIKDWEERKKLATELMIEKEK
ncbi:MAG: AI-2E family transporter [Bacteroidetes bacterium]|nr:AI-2E family transporter [Bacteroidota bacterium]